MNISIMRRLAVRMRFSGVRKRLFHDEEEPVRECGRDFSVTRKRLWEMTEGMRKRGKTAVKGILSYRARHRVRGKTTHRLAGTTEKKSLRARRVSVFRKRNVKIFYFRYLTDRQPDDAARHCRHDGTERRRRVSCVRRRPTRTGDNAKTNILFGGMKTGSGVILL